MARTVMADKGHDLRSDFRSDVSHALLLSLRRKIIAVMSLADCTRMAVLFLFRSSSNL